jgi:hypothetical protein
MSSRAFIHFIRAIALMVLGWLPFHLGGTGNGEPQVPIVDLPPYGEPQVPIVDLPPYPQIILGYTNRTLWYPWNESNPSRTPWVRNGILKPYYTMFSDYETPWITERLEADSCKSLLPFILANDTRRAAFNQKFNQQDIPQYIKDQCLVESLASIGLSDYFKTTTKTVFGKPFVDKTSNCWFSMDAWLKCFRSDKANELKEKTSKPYGVGLLNMHALLKFFTSDEASELRVTPFATPDYQVRVAVVDTYKLYYSSSLDDTTASRNYPMFHYVNDANASFNAPPGHSFGVSQVLFSPNTTLRASNGVPIDRNPFIVGAVYSSQLMHRQAWIRNELPYEPLLRDQRNKLSQLQN